jgi:hypothetical protein
VFFYPNYKSISNNMYYLSEPTSQKIHNLYPLKRTSTPMLGSGMNTINLRKKRTILESRKQVRSLSSHTNTLLAGRMPHATTIALLWDQSRRKPCSMVLLLFQGRTT